MYTTLKQIEKCNPKPCSDGWEKLLKYLRKTESDDKRLYFKTILKSNGIKDAVWALRTLSYDDQCLFLADVAGSVLHIFEKQFRDDRRPSEAIQAIRDFKAKKINKGELSTAFTAAFTAAFTSYAHSAAYAAYAAYSAAYAAYSASDAAYYASIVGSYAARASDTYSKKWEEIEQLFIKHFCESKS